MNRMTRHGGWKGKRRLLRATGFVGLGISLMATAALPAIYLAGEERPVHEVLSFMEETRKFFGCWPAAGLLLGFMGLVPIVGACILGEGVQALMRRRRGPPRRQSGGR